MDVITDIDGKLIFIKLVNTMNACIQMNIQLKW